jgi:hypothetical protein
MSLFRPPVPQSMDRKGSSKEAAHTYCKNQGTERLDQIGDVFASAATSRSWAARVGVSRSLAIRWRGVAISQAVDRKLQGALSDAWDGIEWDGWHGIACHEYSTVL